MSYLIILAVLWSGHTIWRLYILARFFQLEGYQASRYIHWLFASRERFASNRLMTGFVGGVGIAQILIAIGIESRVVHLIWWALVGLVIAWPTRSKEVKNPFVWTQRATRLTVTAFVIAAILNLAGAITIGSSTDVEAGHLLVGGVIGLLVFVFAPGFLPLGNWLMFPVEATLRRGFIAKARRRLKQANPTVIGITGSYGKTSTKVYLAHILSGKYRVLATPKSYNTLMGVCIVINHDLDPAYGYEYFITEMGAYVRGEIAEICELVHPDIGVLIAIGPQHLERFGSIENIEKAKYELIEALPLDGVGVFNADDERVRTLSARPHPTTRYSISTQSDNDHGSRLVADNIRYTADGLAFDVIDRDTGEQRTFNTRLIGLHNVTNILLAAMVARHVGMSLNEIAMRVATLQPEEHRLTRTIMPNGVTILDDAYNTNPIGAANALEVLGLNQSGRRILITPGMVELGALQDQENEALGKLATTHCTDIVLVGKRQTQPIQRGIQSTDFDPAHVQVFDTIQEAIQWYQQTVQPGDAVLFLNDLSDNYL